MQSGHRHIRRININATPPNAIPCVNFKDVNSLVYEEALIRTAHHDERDALMDIWKQVFGSDDAKLFFDLYFSPQTCVVAQAVNSPAAPAAMGFVFPVGSLELPGNSVACSMIFALATLPEHRKRGYAAAIVEKLIAMGNETGRPVTVLCPSSDGVFEYYKAKTPFREMFYINTQVHQNPKCATSDSIAFPISPQEYNQHRCTLLAGKPHIKMDLRAIEYQYRICQEFGGALLKIQSKCGISLAAVEITSSDTALAKELLPCPGADTEELVAAIYKLYPKNKFITRQPAVKTDDSVNITRFGMIYSSRPELYPDLGQICLPWYGFAFD